ncbi:hypothetical protein MAPG_02761 [Magnaporthiopsis poae ATCC 64411]|uniref:NmrA-like domain-containing protein n=1 Tax=Magnaporthiopsis poae (strain ATCC 64411 / 73-15) TaxID=644358 RepID=A0A0C4DS84_MAGP6|nr:hypothetical protein MAPG_02761 [Magnaporthiopsis poae ATCC 64411]
MAPITRVAIAGASGALGLVVLKHLVEAGFDVTVLSRAPGKLPAEYASSAKEIVVDYGSKASLEAALRGQDAVVSTLSDFGGYEAQKPLVEAAVSAGVSRFIPSEFGSNLQHPVVRTLPFATLKVEVEEMLIREASSSAHTANPITYTFIYTNIFLDWGLEEGFTADLENKTATLYNGGSTPLSYTRLPTIAQAVVAVLRRPAETANKIVRIHDGILTQKEFLDAIQEVTGPWTIDEDDVVALQARADEAYAKGILNYWVINGWIMRASHSPGFGAGFVENENKLLGLKEHSTDEMKELVRTLVKDIVENKKYRGSFAKALLSARKDSVGA